MAKVTKLEVQLGRTVNLGNFESARVDVTISVDLEQGDDPEETYEFVLNEARRKVRAEVAYLLGKDL